MNDILNFGGHDYEIYDKCGRFFYSLIDARTDTYVGSVNFQLRMIFVSDNEPYYDNYNAKKVLPKIEFINIAKKLGFDVCDR